MSIKEKINSYAKTVDLNLEKVLQNGDNDYKSVTDAMRYSALAGGKRIRPFVMHVFNKLCNGNGQDVLNFALALEMIHTYSLIHDDLPCMDNDDMRRGKPSCHKAFGEDTALLAGDALLTKAFCVASDTENVSPDLIVKAIKELSIRAGVDGMIGGQAIDLESENKQINEQTLLKMYSLKTCDLLKCAARIGCILANADEDKICAATEYAQNIGLAFQIQDDILDVTSTAEMLGKPIGSDKDNDKSTFVAVYGLENAKKKVIELTEKAVECLSAFDNDTSLLIDLAYFLADRNN